MAAKAYSEMNAEELQVLLNHPKRMRILWRSSDNNEVRTISDDISVAAIQAFSPYCARLLAFNRGRPAPGGKSTITIHGGSFDHFSEVFQAIVGYCSQGSRTVNFGALPFFNSAKLIGAAKHLEMHGLEQKIKNEVEKLRKTVPAPEDVKAILLTYDRHHPARVGVVDSLANAITENRLEENKAGLVALRANNAAFDNALKQAINAKRAKAVEAKAKENWKKIQVQAKRDREWPALGE